MENYVQGEGLDFVDFVSGQSEEAEAESFGQEK